MRNYFNELRWKIIWANNLLQFIHQVTIEIKFWKSLALVKLVKLETLQVIVKSHWQHTSLDETMKSSQSEFYANA